MRIGAAVMVVKSATTGWPMVEPVGISVVEPLEKTIAE